MLGRTAPAAIPMGYRIEELGAWVAEVTGADPRLVRSPEERVQMQQQAAQLIAENREAA